jgi:hypothetical protein
MAESTERPTKAQQSKKKENPLLSLMFNIILPVAALQNLSKHLGENGPLWALLIGLSLPIGYGIYDYITRREKNLMSAIGIISVVFTGGLALVQAEGIWFAIVEMGLPLIFGIAVLASAFTATPFIAKMTYNDVFMHIDKVEDALKQKGNLDQFKKLLRTSTLFLSSSFFLSAVLNFVLAIVIFVPIDAGLSDTQRADILNDQIAEMRYKSVFVIMLPLMIFSMAIMWHLFSGIKKLTGLELEEVIKTS